MKNPMGPGRLSGIVRLAGAAAGIGGTLVALAMLSSEASSRSGPDGARLLGWALGATLALAVAFCSLTDYMRRDDQTVARGRCISAGRGAPGLWSSARIALACLALTLLIMTALEVAAQAVSVGPAEAAEANVRERARQEQEAHGADGPDESTGTGVNGTSSGSSMIGPGTTSPGDQSLGLSTQLGNLLSGEPAFRVLAAGPAPQTTLHLKALILDEYAANGTLRERRSSDAEVFTSNSTGWIQTSDKLPDHSGPVLELDIQFLRPSNGVVYAPAQLQAIHAESVHHDPASDVWLLSDMLASRYSVRSSLPEVPLSVLASARSRGSLPGVLGTRLPNLGAMGSRPRGASARQRALSELETYAEAITADSDTDLHAVLAIVSHLRSTFGYELYDASMLSPRGCTKLIERGAGSCTHFASLAAILLRSLNIPTRIAVGYVAREPIEDEFQAGWTVRARDGHAWIEVHFEGLGWLPFDPTPGDSAGEGMEYRWTPLSDSTAAIAHWAGMEIDGVGPAARTSARTSVLGEVIADTAGRVIASIGVLLRGWSRQLRLPSGALTGVLAIFVALGLVLWWRWSRLAITPAPDCGAAAARTDGATHESRPPLPEARALMEALASRDLMQSATETPSRFARSVENRHTECAGLLGAIRTLLRSASSRSRLSDLDRAKLRDLARRIDAGGSARETPE